ncbi:MAG: RluA family pseudouridine synthase [Victivallales bacterium]|nr:RluA family pseudouridine synthase [Victivallales bacterium]
MLSIIHEDNHLFCLDKPGGILTQPSGTDRASLEEEAKAWLKEAHSKPGAVFLEAVHRIDAAACGIVLFAKTSKALSRLTAAIREGKCEKEYRVLVERPPKRPSGELRDWLRHDEHRAFVVRPNSDGAKEAVLTYETLGRRPDGTALLKVMLESGRYHQIRAQFANAGCPVVGDARYGASTAYRRGCIALQHYCLRIEHPVTREQMVFVSRIRL